MGLLRVPAIATIALILSGTVNVTPVTRQQSLTPAEAQQAPGLPHTTIEIPALQPGSRTIHVPADGNLQEALDAVQPGETITLDPAGTYQGPFHLRRKDGDRWIVITSASAPPRAGRPVASESAFPRLVSSGDPVFIAEPGSHHYRFVGLEMSPVDGEYLNTVVQLGDAERSTEAQPHHFIVDRCFIHGDPARGARRGIALNSRHTAVIDSRFTDFKEVGADTQAIGGWNGAGPFRIAGNYLEAAGENVMFGGADPSVPGLVPADIEIVRNHFTKPMRWKSGEASFEGTEWTVKNLFELKNARRVLVEGNVFEHNWPQAQNGFAILFTVRNQDGGAPWSQVEDVRFVNNLIRHVAGGINILGHDDNHPSQQTRRILIANNVFLDVGGQWGNGRLFQLLDGTSGITIEHNTAFQTGSVMFGGDHAPHTAFAFRNNIAVHNEHGISGSSTDIGTPSLQRYFPGADVRGNVLVGGPSGRYPRDNMFPGSLEDLGDRVLRRNEFSLRLAPEYARGGTDGSHPGADLTRLARALDGVAPVGLGEAAAAADNAVLQQVALDADASGSIAGRLALVSFWGALLLLLYIYAGYPLVAALRATLRPRPRIRAAIEPHVSVLVVAHNEEDRIDARIDNLLALDYPPDHLEIVIASDGSTDATAARAQRHGDRIEVWTFPTRRGKTAVISAIVPALRGEIVLFADARQRFEPDALKALVANFADPSVGGVSGELVLDKPDAAATASQGTALYWCYEKFIRSTEGRADSTVGATGAIYAIRRDLFEPIPADTILDDVLIPLNVVKRGFRVLFEPGARAHDAVSSTARQEFTRKARTIAGTFQLFSREPWLLDPRRNRLWFETISHKGLRLMLPVLHLVLLLATCALVAEPFYRLVLAAQAAFYGAALVGYLQRGARRRSFVFSVPCAICLLSWATVVGFVRFLTGRQRVTWERVQPTGMHPA